VTTSRTPPWAEAIQLIPILALAFPFIVEGHVDLESATSGFVVATALAVLCSIQVLRHGHRLNPVLLGTDLWLVFGAIAFGLDLAPLRAWFGETQAFGLFAGVFVVGLVTTWRAPGGVRRRRPDPPRPRPPGVARPPRPRRLGPRLGLVPAPRHPLGRRSALHRAQRRAPSPGRSRRTSPPRAPLTSRHRSADPAGRDRGTLAAM